MSHSTDQAIHTEEQKYRRAIHHRVAIVIPAYNEEKTIRALAEKALQQSGHVIIVNDGSTDNTLQQLSGLPVHIINNETNLGKAGSLWKGMQAAIENHAEVVITLDGDGQHNPDDIPRLIERQQQRPSSLIIAARLLNREHAPRARLFANNFADFWISWAAGQRVYDSQSGFRLYPVSLLKQIEIDHSRQRGFVFESEIAILSAWHGFPCVSVPIDSLYLHDGRPSHFEPVADITKIVLMVAWKIISKGLNIPGLWRVLLNKPIPVASYP